MKWICNVCSDQGHTCTFKLKTSGCSRNGQPPFEPDRKPEICLYSEGKTAKWERKRDIDNTKKEELKTRYKYTTEVGADFLLSKFSEGNKCKINSNIQDIINKYNLNTSYFVDIKPRDSVPSGYAVFKSVGYDLIVKYGDFAYGW